MPAKIVPRLLLPLLLAARIPAAPAAQAPADLKADYRIDPLGLDRLPVRLSWRMADEGRVGAAQSAYRLQVASAPDGFELPGVWDSGKRDSSGAVHRFSPQAAPAAGQRFWWRVKLWDETGAEGAWSGPAQFEMGVAGDPDWEAAPWIGCDRDFERPEPAPAEQMGDWIRAEDDRACRGFFAEIELPDKPVVSAIAYWGLSGKAGPAAVVANYGRRQGYKRTPLDRVMRPAKGGSADLSFYLEPGAANRLEIRFQKPARGVTAAAGANIVFADGEEMPVRTGAGWRVIPAADGGPEAPATVAAPYGDAKLGEAEIFGGTNLPPAWFRGSFPAREGIRRARLYLCALGQGVAHLNGRPVSGELLSPPQSDYEARAYYTAHDIAPLLRPGENTIAVLLDAGWFHEVGGFGAVFSYGRPGLKALAVLEYADGKRETFSSGPGWEWKEGAIRAANVYRGERIDFRRDHDEWKTAGAGSGWKPAQVLPPRSPETVAMDVLPVVRGEPVRPANRRQIGPKTWLYDMGAVMFGWVRFTLEEPEGATVRLRYSESADGGTIENVPGSQWWCHGVAQGDTAVAAGGKRLFEPVFTAKSFRFVELGGVSAPPGDFAGIPVRSAAGTLASFESSDPMLDRLFQNGMRTWRNYVAHSIADIPRERCLWGAESIYTEVPGAYCYDFATNHRLMLDLWCSGAMTPEGIPGNIGVGKRLTTLTQSFAWSVTPVFLASHLFEHYGDLEAARPHYRLLRHILHHAEKTGERGGTIPVPHGIGDHAPPQDIPRKAPGNALVNALVFFEAEHRFARLADALGEPEDAARARAHAEKVRATILESYDAGKRTFGVGTLDSLALAYGLVGEPAEREKLAASLAGIYRANGHRFDGGFLSHEIYPQLSRFGHAADALKMLVNTEPPGPARSVKIHDATTFWEAYYADRDFQMFRGLDFVAFAHSIGWMLTDLAGIRYRITPDGRTELALAPKFPAGLDRAAGTVETPAGTVRSAWGREGDAVAWEIGLPPNTAAEVDLAGWGRVEVDGKTEEAQFRLPAGKWRVLLRP